jgi:hypothetical protein
MMAIALSNLRYADQSNTLIDMDVSGWFTGETIPFTYHPSDTAPLTQLVAPLLSGQTIAAYAAPAAPVPTSVTRRQMILGLVGAGYITSAEGLAAAQQGAVPAAVQAVINTLPDQASKDAAAITWASMSICERSNSLVAALAAANSLTSAQVDALFQSWVTL